MYLGRIRPAFIAHGSREHFLRRRRHPPGPQSLCALQIEKGAVFARPRSCVLPKVCTAELHISISISISISTIEEADNSRCHRLDIACEVPAPVRRTRDTKLKHRIERIEDSLGNIVSLLSNNQGSTLPRNDPPQIDQATPQSHNTPSGAESNAYSTPAQNITVSEPPWRKFITVNEAEAYCDRYRTSFEPQFPYALLPKDRTAQELQDERPLMLLAILAALSWQNRRLQQSIGKLYLEILSQRFFVNGEYSLDMLQSLLIYISWYQFHINLPGHQPYRLASLAVTMLIELGLDKKPREFQLQQAVSDSNNSIHLIDPARPDMWSAEARRAVVGCYHVAAYTSISYRRLNTMSSVTCVEDYALSLAADKNRPCDAYLISQVQLMRVVEEMRNTFDYYGVRSPDKILSEERIQAYGQVFTTKLNTIKAQLQTFSPYPTYLRCLYHLSDMCLYEIGLYAFNKNATPSIPRISLLLDFLESSRLYMELVMVLTKEEMCPWTFFDWRQLNFALITTNQVIVALDPSIATAESVARLTSLVSYLDWACLRLREVYALDDTRERHFEGLEHLLSLWKATQSWSENLLARATTAQQSQELPQHQVWPAYTNMAPNLPTPAPSFPPFDDITAQTANSMDLWSDSGFWWQTNAMS